MACPLPNSVLFRAHMQNKDNYYKGKSDMLDPFKPEDDCSSKSNAIKKMPVSMLSKGSSQTHVLSRDELAYKSSNKQTCQSSHLSTHIPLLSSNANNNSCTYFTSNSNHNSTNTLLANNAQSSLLTQTQHTSPYFKSEDDVVPNDVRNAVLATPPGQQLASPLHLSLGQLQVCYLYVVMLHVTNLNLVYTKTLCQFLRLSLIHRQSRHVSINVTVVLKLPVR